MPLPEGYKSNIPETCANCEHSCNAIGVLCCNINKGRPEITHILTNMMNWRDKHKVHFGGSCPQFKLEKQRR